MPEKLAEGPFRLFPSRPENQSRTDDFLRSCGSIQLAERMLGWLREGLVSGEYREDGSGEEKFRVLLLRTADPSLGDEAIDRAWLRWESDARMRRMRSRERELMVRYRRIGPQPAGTCDLVRGAFPTYDAAYVMLDYFESCAEFYLDRMFGPDLLGPAISSAGFRSPAIWRPCGCYPPCSICTSRSWTSFASAIPRWTCETCWLGPRPSRPPGRSSPLGLNAIARRWTGCSHRSR